ncbi:MAG: ribonuclease P protein component [Bacteroidales bacterium]|nr:ribonuclease P protein component [Bacteroidales bacterium]
MDSQTPNTLPKKERLCGKTTIGQLLAKGKHGNVPGLRFLYMTGTGSETNRIMVSVPKKMFKRAVKRNLLKRRIRESWRKQKHALAATGGTDILFIYPTKEIQTYEQIYNCVGQIIEKINKTQTNIQNQNEIVAE